MQERSGKDYGADGSGAHDKETNLWASGAYFHGLHEEDKRNHIWIAHRTDVPNLPHLTTTVAETSEIIFFLEVAVNKQISRFRRYAISDRQAIFGHFIRSAFRAKIKLERIPTESVLIIQKGRQWSLAVSCRLLKLNLIFNNLKKLIRKPEFKHLMKRRMLHKVKRGFLKGRSRLSNLLSFLDGATENFDKGQVSETRYLDFNKAFDSDNYQVMI